MKRMILFFILLLTSFIWASDFREEEKPWSRGPFHKTFDYENTKEIDESECNLLVKSNVLGSSVYLNGSYYGITPLALTGLTAGRYDIKIVKDGYEPFYSEVHLKKGRENVYHVNLIKEMGLLSVISNVDNCQMMIDYKELVGDTIELEKGSHTVTIKKFGYDTKTLTVNIIRGYHKTVYVNLSPCAFELKSFYSNKKAFNPSYKGDLGRCSFVSTVTGPSNGSFEVYDKNDNLVYSKEINNFDYWYINTYWDGRDKASSLLPEGSYKVCFKADKYIKECFVHIDYSITYNLCDITDSGLGIGTIPVPLSLPQGTNVVSISTGPLFSSESYEDYKIDLSYASVLPLNLELAGSLKFYPRYEETPLNFTGSLKFCLPIGHVVSGYGLSYGYYQANIYGEGGFYNGCGLSPYVMLGLNYNKFYAGFTSLFDFGSSTCNPGGKDNVWNNSITMLIKPSNIFSIGLKGGVNSAFGIYDYKEEEVKNEVEFFRAIDYSLGLSYMLPNSSVVFKSNINLYSIIGHKTYLDCCIALNYMF